MASEKFTCEKQRKLAATFILLNIKDKDASKPVACDFSLPNHSTHKITIWGFSLQRGNTESRNKH